MSNFQIGIMIFLVFLAGTIVALALLDRRESREDQEHDDAEQLAAITNPAPLLWGGAQTITQRRAGTQGD